MHSGLDPQPARWTLRMSIWIDVVPVRCRSPSSGDVCTGWRLGTIGTWAPPLPRRAGT